MQTYIYNGSEMQLNLPDALRVRTEKSFKVWSANLMASVTIDSLDDRERRRSEGSVNVTATVEDAGIPGINQETVLDSVPHNNATTHATKPVYNKFGSMAFLESIIPGGLQIVTSTDSGDTGTSNAPNILLPDRSVPNPHSNPANPQQYATPLTNKADNYIINNNLRTPLSGAGISGTTTSSSLATNSNPFSPLHLRINTDTTRSMSGLPLQFLHSDSVDTMDTGFGSIQPSMAPSTNLHPNAIAKPRENATASGNSTSSYQITVPKQRRSLNAPTIANSAPLPTQPNTIAAADAMQLHFDADITLDLSFIDLFKETKAEILRLLRDDKFPRFKNTNQFASFIANVKPYEKESFFDQSLIKSGHNNDRYSLDFDLSR